MSENFNHPLITGLSSNYRIYLSSFTRRESEALRYAEMLHRPDLVRSVIPQTLGILEQFRNPPELGIDNGVREGWQLLQNYFEDERPSFKKKGTIPIVYGSLEYGDPQNLDFDVLLASRDHSRQIESSAHGWHHDLATRKWLNNSEGHVSYASLQNLDELIKMVQRGDRTELEENAWKIDDQFVNASIILSGVALYPEDNAKLMELRVNTFKRVASEPLLAAYVAYCLNETLEERQRRR